MKSVRPNRVRQRWDLEEREFFIDSIIEIILVDRP